MLLIIFSIILYMCPTLLAIYYNHPYKIKIILFNIFFSWSIICWFIALFWVMTIHFETKYTNLKQRPKKYFNPSWN